MPNYSAFRKRNRSGLSRASRLRLAQDCTSKSFLGGTFGKSAADWVCYEKEDFGQYLPEDSGEVENASQRTRPLCVLRARKIYGGDGDRSAWQKKKNWQAVPPPLKVVTHEAPLERSGAPQPLFLPRLRATKRASSAIYRAGKGLSERQLRQQSASGWRFPLVISRKEGIEQQKWTMSEFMF